MACLGGAATLIPFGARAQQAALPVIGFLAGISSDGFSEHLRGFRQGLKESGYVEGENVLIEYRWAENQLDRLPALATDLVRKRVTVIAAHGGTAPAIAAKAATSSIPIVFTIPENPVEYGLVASLSRPGSNATGINIVIGELMSKRLELLNEMVPRMARVAVFVNSANSARAENQVKEAEAAASAIGLKAQIYRVATQHEINAAFTALAGDRPDAIFVCPDPFFNGHKVQLAILAARHGLPSSFSARHFPEAGGLMSYGPDVIETFRQAGVYTGRVLKGAKPSDMPVAQAAKFELVINSQTAKALSLVVPSTLLASADQVIE